MDRRRSGSTLTVTDREPAPASELLSGTKIDRFEIVGRLGAGGMGVVYKAYEPKLDRYVALKGVRTRPDMDAMRARLEHEAKAMAKLKHRNVVPIYDLVSHAGDLFLAMEFVEGNTLRAWLTDRRSWRDVVRMFLGAGRGLEAAHAAGLLHRDFKPDNVMVDSASDARITDFGLARVLAEEVTLSGDGAPAAHSATPVTVTGRIAGTPAYMAPEAFDQRSVGPAADQFSFCVALFEALYGARPFMMTSANPAAVVNEIAAGRIAKLPGRGVPRRVHAAIVRGLAHDPARRWISMGALVAELERAIRDRRAMFFAFAAIAMAVLEIGPSAPEPGCLEIAKKRDDAVTVPVCREEFARTRDPSVGVQLAKALRQSELWRDAEAVATGLLATSARADALYTLGKIATDEDRRGDCARHFRLAAESHREQQQWSRAAEDRSSLAACLNDFVEKLVEVDQSLIDARRGDDRRTEGLGHLYAANVLASIGARTAALHELGLADPLLPNDRVKFDLERGNMYQNLGEQTLAVDAFESALRGAESAGATRRALTALLNLAYSLAESGDVATAAQRLKRATVLDRTNDLLSERLSIEARIAARVGEFARAGDLVERALSRVKPEALDLRVEYETQRAEIALQQRDLSGAEQWARRAISHIEGGTGTSSAGLSSWLVTDYQIPYHVLFTSLALRGDARGALLVFERYGGVAALAELVHRDGVVRAAPGIAFPAAELARVIAGLTTSRFAEAVQESTSLDAARGGALLVLVAAGDDLWRITGESGRLDIDRIGELRSLQQQIEQLRVHPGDVATASALGELLVPVGLMVSSDQPVQVVLDQPLASLPVAALQVGGRRLVASRPVVRAVRVADLSCETSINRPRPVVVLGIPPEAIDRRDGLVAQADATRQALFAVRPSEVLHVGVPAADDALGATLELHDGPLRALEIVAHGGAPAQVVVLAPSQKSSLDLAVAFLAAGAAQVIVPLVPISSAAAARVTRQLYRSDTSDLVRALARVQAVSTVDDDWLGLGVFGRALCQ